MDTKTPGAYELTYVTKFLWKEYSAVRKVIVADREPPVVVLKHTEGYSPNWFTGYEEEGYTATDNCDGDVTDRVVRSEGDGIIPTPSPTAPATAPLWSGISPPPRLRR